jgi:tRNA A37 threonylcarbamoyladenosine biosynthesis protein TsaE
MKDNWATLVARILGARTADHLLVAIDGVDGAGKTTFARTLVELLRRELGDSAADFPRSVSLNA